MPRDERPGAPVRRRIRLAAADDEPDAEAARANGTRLWALRDHPADHPGAGPPDTSHGAAATADSRAGAAKP